jgi:hypothetical protein
MRSTSFTLRENTAAASIMNFDSNFFDKVYEENFLIKQNRSIDFFDGDNAKSRNNTNYKINNVNINKANLMRISSVDSIVFSDDAQSSVTLASNDYDSPLTDTTNEDDIDWECVSDEEELIIRRHNDNNKGEQSSMRNFSNTFTLSTLDDDEEEEIDEEKESNCGRLQNKRQESMTIMKEKKPTPSKKSEQGSTTWNPFGIPIPPALVWFSVMKQQVQKLPITRQDVSTDNYDCNDKNCNSDSSNNNCSGNDKVQKSGLHVESTISMESSLDQHQNKNATKRPSLLFTDTQQALKQQTSETKRKPLSRSERKIRNRQAALASRKKKKQQLEELNNELKRLKSLLLEKGEYIDKLESENAYLKSQLVDKRTSNNNKLQSSLSINEGEKTQHIDITNSNDIAILQPARKRQRVLNNGSNMLSNSLKISVACSMAMCLFTDDGTSTAFVFDHVSHIHNHIALMKISNMFFTMCIFSAFLICIMSFQIKKCTEKTKSFLLPLFKSTSNRNNRRMDKKYRYNNHPFDRTRPFSYR